ncbi:adenylate/guanylate cyclase domain-containing protein [Bacteroidota bacterium]
MPEDRRLAAIMFTDIVGYTALMGKDEDQAFKLLRRNREIQQHLVKNHKGVWLKEMGDGILAQFDSATDAVLCAIEIQQRAREELEGQIRIGIHLGDVTFENEDVFGDGVNIASRLQSVTDPGGIYISESTQKAIRGKSEIQTRYLGEFNLKNVDYPVRTYCVQGEGLPIPSGSKIKELTGKGLKERIFGSVITYIVFLLILVSISWWIRKAYFMDQSTISSLLVLPVDNYTDIDTLDYYMAGMHSSLCTDIGKINSLRVPSKTTANAYKKAGKSMAEIASELNVNYIIEPSVLCLGDSICLRISLHTAGPVEKQIWVQDYSVENSQILNLYNKVAKEISEKINVILTPEEENLLAESRTVDPEAYDAYLKGQFYWEKIDQDFLQRSLDYFQLAIEKDPEWADPYAGLANAWGMFATFFNILPKSVTLPNVYKYLNMALELDPKSAQAHYVKAIVAVWTEFDWVQGEEEFLKSLELNPNDALCRIYYSHLLMILSRSDEAVNQANLALKLDPMKPLILGLYGEVMRMEGNDQSAISHFEKALSIDSSDNFAAASLINMHMRTAYMNGDYEKWIEMWDNKVHGHWNDEGRMAVLNAFHEKGHIAAIEEMFKMNEKYGNDCRMISRLKGERYLKLNNYDKAMDCLEKEYEIREMFMTYITTNLDIHDQLKDNPRYIELLKKMNLPLP